MVAARTGLFVPLGPATPAPSTASSSVEPELSAMSPPEVDLAAAETLEPSRDPLLAIVKPR
jgi:hypothetical protein